METRRLGRTGHMSTIVIFGAAALGRVSQKEADAALEEALEHGVNHIDVAPTYGEAELRLGPWMEKIRPDVFLGCKTTERTKAGAREELHRSLERLRVDSFDLYQLHAVGELAELEAALGPGGAIEAFIEAREKGLVRYLGITGHGLQAPAVQAVALERFDFDTVMFPLNFILYANPNYRRDCRRLLDLAQRKDVGSMVIKAFAKGPWKNEAEKTAIEGCAYATWYEPFDDQAHVRRCLNFVLSQGVTGATNAGDVRLLPMILDAAESYQPISQAEQAELVGAASAFLPLFT